MSTAAPVPAGRLPERAPVAPPAHYVPRRATERVLAELQHAALRAGVPGVLLAPAGFGKTLLLHVLAARLAHRLRPVYLPHPGLPQSELCSFTLGLLGRPAGAYPEVDLLSAAMELRGAGSALLLLLDDAQALPPAAARGLAGLAAVSHGGLRLVLAGLDDERGERVAEVVGSPARVVVFTTAMSRDETATYLRRRLPDLLPRATAVERLSPDLLTRIHEESEGVPARIPFAIEGLRP